MTPDDIVVEPRTIDGRLDFARLFGWSMAGARPVELEIGCGKGRFLMGAARARPNHDFLAVEQVRRLVRKVRDRALRAKLANVRLYHGNAKDVMARLLPPSSLARVHVYFPDPWPKRRHAKHRIFAGEALDHLAAALEPGGELLFATDHDPYFREVVGRLAVHPAFVRTLPDVFRTMPRGGFDALFEARGIPVLRATWQVREGP